MAATGVAASVDGGGDGDGCGGGGDGSGGYGDGGGGGDGDGVASMAAAESGGDGSIGDGGGVVTAASATATTVAGVGDGAEASTGAVNNGINPCHHPLSPLTKLPSPVDELTTPTSCLRLHPPTSHVSVFIPSSSPHVSVFIPPTFIPPTSPSSSPLRFTFACNLQPSSSPPRLRLHPPPTSPSSSPLRFTLHAICSAITLHAIYQTFLVQR